MTESGLSLKHETLPSGVTYIVAEGQLDANTSGQLDEMVGAITTGGSHRIIVDLEQVTYISSSGVGVFVGFVNSCREQGGDIVLIYPWGMEGKQGEVGLSSGYNALEVFNLLGLTDFFKVVNDKAQAEAAFE